MVILVIAMTALFAPNAKGQIAELPFGSVEKVEQYATTNINRIFLSAWYFNKTNSTWTPFAASDWYGGTQLTNKGQMDTMVTNEISSIFSNFVAHTNANINKDKGLQVVGTCYSWRNGNPRYSFRVPYTFIIPDKTNGVYKVPQDIVWPSTKINTDIPFYISKLKWVRLEIGIAGNPIPFEVHDNRIDPTTDILSSDGFMYLPTEVIMESSKTNGLFWINLTIFHNNSFQEFNGDGQQITEKPLRTQNSIANGVVTVTVSGGDSGRAYLLLQSSNLINWTSCSPVSYVSPFTHLFPGGTTQSFQYQSTTGSLFYRTVTTNVPPE